MENNKDPSLSEDSEYSRNEVKQSGSFDFFKPDYEHNIQNIPNAVEKS